MPSEPALVGMLEVLLDVFRRQVVGWVRAIALRCGEDFVALFVGQPVERGIVASMAVTAFAGPC